MLFLLTRNYILALAHYTYSANSNMLMLDMYRSNVYHNHCWFAGHQKNVLRGQNPKRLGKYKNVISSDCWPKPPLEQNSEHAEKFLNYQNTMPPFLQPKVPLSWGLWIMESNWHINSEKDTVNVLSSSVICVIKSLQLLPHSAVEVLCYVCWYWALALCISSALRQPNSTLMFISSRQE